MVRVTPTGKVPLIRPRPNHSRKIERIIPWWSGVKGRGQGRVKGYREEEVTCEGRAGRRKGEGMRKDDGDFMCEVK